MIHEDSKLKRNTTPIVLAIGVVIILIIAPIGSYLFLRKGFEYRVESIKQLEPKQVSSQLNGIIKLKSPFKGNARLIHIPGTNLEAELKILFQIDDKIVDRARFDIYSLTEDSIGQTRHKINFVPSQHITSHEEQFILIDTSDVIRATYSFHNGVEQEIMRHLSVVIPMQTSRSVNLNRESK